MAIHRYCQCQILVNGIPAEEYDDSSDDNSNDTGGKQSETVTKYIKVVSGTQFSIKLSVLSAWTWSTPALAWKIFLDGRVSERHLIKEYDLPLGKPSHTSEGEHSLDGKDWVVRKFRFADVVIGDLPEHMSASEIKARYSGLGQIRVEVHRYIPTGCRQSKEHKRLREGKETNAIPEKALKGQALNLATTLGEAEKSIARYVCHGRYPDVKPLESFVFLYRSKQALQQLMIIPRSPTPTPLEERPINELNVEEARELLRRRVEAETVQKVKSETKANLKRERASTISDKRASKVSRTADGKEYIDLVDDSEDDRKKEGLGANEVSKKTKTKVEVIDLFE